MNDEWLNSGVEKKLLTLLHRTKVQIEKREVRIESVAVQMEQRVAWKDTTEVRIETAKR